MIIIHKNKKHLPHDDATTSTHQQGEIASQRAPRQNTLCVTFDTLEECRVIASALSKAIAHTRQIPPSPHWETHTRAHHYIFFDGGLGAGKTAFCRELIMHVFPNVKRVPSPTFTLMQTYEAEDKHHDHPITDIVHADLYRLENGCNTEELGFRDFPTHTLFLVEWAERMKHAYPTEYLEIDMQFWQDSATRLICFKGTPSWLPCIHLLTKILQETR